MTDPFCPLFIDRLLNSKGPNISDALNFVMCERSLSFKPKSQYLPIFLLWTLCLVTIELKRPHVICVVNMESLMNACLHNSPLTARIKLNLNVAK